MKTLTEQMVGEVLDEWSVIGIDSQVDGIEVLGDFIFDAMYDDDRKQFVEVIKEWYQKNGTKLDYDKAKASLYKAVAEYQKKGKIKLTPITEGD